MLLLSRGPAGGGSWAVTALSREWSTGESPRGLGFVGFSVGHWGCEGSGLAACAIRVKTHGLLVFPLFTPELLCFAAWHRKLIIACFSCLQEVPSLPLSLPPSTPPVLLQPWQCPQPLGSLCSSSPAPSFPAAPLPRSGPLPNSLQLLLSPGCLSHTGLMGLGCALVLGLLLQGMSSGCELSVESILYL